MSEYLYIVFVSILFLYSCIKLSDNFKINRTAYYILVLNFFIIIYAFKGGTELLSLSLLQLFLAFIKQKKSGFFFSLLNLTRYTNVVYILLFVFQKNLKKIAISLGVSILIFSPWLFYNWSQTGDMFTSLGDSYAINIKSRQGTEWQTPFKPETIVIVLNFTLIFFILGLLKISREKYKENNFLFILVFIITLIGFFNTPTKEPRYLINIVVPAAYFGSLYLSNKKRKALILISFVLLNLFSVYLFWGEFLQGNNSMFSGLSSKIKCQAKSNVWPILTYYGIPSEPFPQKDEINIDLEMGYRIVLFKNIVEPDYVNNITFMKELPLMEETDFYYIVGYEDMCKPFSKINHVFLKEYSKRAGSSEITGCSILLGKGVCKFLGFDEYVK